MKLKKTILLALLILPLAGCVSGETAPRMPMSYSAGPCGTLQASTYAWASWGRDVPLSNMNMPTQAIDFSFGRM